MKTPRELREQIKAELTKLPAVDRQADGFRGEPAALPVAPAASPTGLAPNPAQGASAAPPLAAAPPTLAERIRAQATKTP